MKISALITLLQDYLLGHGDLDVDTECFDGRRISLEPNRVIVRYRKILKGRERKDGFYCHYYDTESAKGEKVLSI